MSIKPNLSLLRDHGVSGKRHAKWKLKHNILLKDPFLYKFYNDHHILYYLAAKHTSDPNSKTFKFIKDAVSKVDLVIIEGINFNKGVSPKLDMFSSEGEYAYKMANKYKIPYVGIEPSDKILYSLKNVKKRDIILYVCLQQYKLFIRENRTFKEFVGYIDVLIQYFLKLLNVKKFDFMAYFRKRINCDFEYGITDLEMASPDEKGKFLTNRIGALLSKIRDAEMMKNLYYYMNKYDKILFICGENHFYAHYKVLKNDLKGELAKL